ncbi:threonine synthase [soil metagenome]
MDLVERLDRSVAAVVGHGFLITPLTRQSALGAALGLGSLWVKDDTDNVGGSHKARHLFGTLLHQALAPTTTGELVIASCGNATLAAAVVARAVEKPLRVFIPTWADPAVVTALKELGAIVVVKKRTAKSTGDPTVAAMQKALEKGATAFSVQGSITPTALDGGRSIGWELAEQLALARVQGTVGLFVQVGGGALATSVWRGLNDGIREQWFAGTPALHTIQTEAAAPLNRALRLVLESFDDWTTAPTAQFMWPWEDVGTSRASGILDDVTYDWMPVMEAMLVSGGAAHVVSENLIAESHRLAREYTDIPADHTATAGLAALLDPTVAEQAREYDHVVVFFTGRER